MSTTNLDSAERDRRDRDWRLRLLDSRYRTTTLQLDLARLEYYQLRRDAGNSAEIARAEQKVVDLKQQRAALRAELDELEDLH